MPVRVDSSSPWPLPGAYYKPGQLRQEYAVDAVLELATIPREVLRQRRPPVPIKPNPERHGYRQTPLRIEDVMATDRWAPKARSWLSGAPSMPLGSGAEPEGGAGLRNYNEPSS